jgi:hypothetical protein
MKQPKRRFLPRGKPPHPLPLLRPLAGRLLAGGHILILLSLCHFVALFHSGSRPEALLYLEPYMASVASSAAVLWAVVLGMDWLDRTDRG